jgi:hypothetical protein
VSAPNAGNGKLRQSVVDAAADLLTMVFTQITQASRRLVITRSTTAKQGENEKGSVKVALARHATSAFIGGATQGID